MIFPLNRGLSVVDKSSSRAALGQIVFQAQIDLGIMSLLYTSSILFWKVEEHLDRIWQSEVLQGRGAYG